MATKHNRRLSCGVVILRFTDSDPLLLLLRSFANWDFPKGMQEPGELPHETALREVREETTIDDLQFPWGMASIDTGPYSKNKVARYFIAMTQTTAVSLPVNPELGHAEHSEWRWMDLREARSLVAPRVARVLDWAEETCAEFAQPA